MGTFARHWTRIAVTLIPLVIALLHASGAMPLGFLQRFDEFLYDARLRATMPKTMDERIVIVDIDEKSLAEIGRWPWGRNRMAQLTDELFDRQQVAVVGFDVVFAEPDDSSGLKRLRQLAESELKDQPGFAARVDQLAPGLDYDAAFARSLRKRPVVLGYYFSSDRGGGRTGVLPAPVIRRQDLNGHPIRLTSWNGYAANIEQIAMAAPAAGFFNPIVDGDGVVRSVPLIAGYEDGYYESLSLAMFRLLLGAPAVEPGYARDRFFSRSYQGLESVVLRLGQKSLGIPVDNRVAALVPFRGPGGAQGGSFRYVSASDLVVQRLPAGSLKGKIILVGTTAPGLQDLRSTPMGETYPGVETHANMISGLLDGRLMVKPDYAVGYDVVVLFIAGVALALALPLISAPKAVLVSLGVLAAVVGLNFWLFLGVGLVLPMAAALALILTAFGLNMSYGYFIESRSKRELANLFGTYVPPELVDEMVKAPDNYTMQAVNKELTVMFCDMRGFTKMSERMEPVQLQELLNAVFNRLSDIIRSHRGTIDKYMGDCVMAFWGAPVDTAEHAHLAVQSAMEMVQAVRLINDEHREKGLPDIGVGIGLNTGMMCVGDMGSQVRRSYTVIGDAVNLGARLEGLSKTYGVDIVVSESTRKLAPACAWQELDRVRVKGKEQSVAIFWPVAPADALEPAQSQELKTWAAFLKAYRAQDWEQCDLLLLNLLRMNPKKYLYELYSERVASMKLLPFDPEWDGATNFENK
ncbi:adenylate/guanylate cyclase domain-containing protein [Ramlibacter henchirensis]|uniref:Adenylate/guanylate cyclase domain-containing protein n=1 Tax=Ramlibacter henchirensis TaxID=204072 RepID=A0A4Z0C8T6_9BURK|nr:adenylate/guanylate cyclase domain-containing protein [Ramlibacter henchirensis]TFZ06830.1 adenylate/guanylate cyclase domain-containing protein [Ramlibacter henchirensis]